jgi:plastocyanin
MGSSRRYVFVAVAATLVLSLAAIVPSATGAAKDDGVIAVTKGTEVFDINGGAVATFRFEPEVITVASGTKVTWKHLDTSRDPHTITIVTSKRQLPHDFEGANCKPCQAADKGHFPNGKRPVPVLNKGAPGLDRDGDSLLIAPRRGASASAVVSAPAGTTLYYVCIIHPWMQGTIKVT